ncbi:MAG: hypothetical protein QM802_24890 [Agriterribacter sp.]
MKATIFIIAGLFSFVTSFAQQPVEWSFHTKKISEGKYEIHLSATIDKGWALISQSSTGDRELAPTEIKLQEAKGIKLSKKIEEQGSMLTKKSAARNVSVKCFENNADFIIILSANSTPKENIKGTISYVAFNGSQTLPAFTVAFSVPLN